MKLMNSDLEPASAVVGDDFVASDEVRQLLTTFVRSRVGAAEVEDVVQTILCAAIASESRPTDREELRRWVIGVARHKVADLHRKGGKGREVELPDQLGSESSESPADDARDLARWAAKQTEGDEEAQRTLGWMAREGRGEKLAHIAADEELPAAQVRQRVSRLRRSLKQRWLRDLAAVAAIGLLALVAWRMLRAPEQQVAPRPDPDVAPVQPDGPILRGRKLRAEALKACELEKWQPCLDGLNRAAKLDPAGDESKTVAGVRARAREALEEESAPPAPTANPTTKPVAPPVKPAPRPRQTKSKKPFPQQKKAPKKRFKGKGKGGSLMNDDSLMRQLNNKKL